MHAMIRQSKLVLIRNIIYYKHHFVWRPVFLETMKCLVKKKKKKNDFQANPKEFFVSEANFNKIDTLNLNRRKVSFLKNLNPPLLSQWSVVLQTSTQSSRGILRKRYDIDSPLWIRLTASDNNGLISTDLIFGHSSILSSTGTVFVTIIWKREIWKKKLIFKSRCHWIRGTVIPHF